ncbi:MAG: GNAT family N-acetyltransferase [Clostridia bacterium]
MDWNDFPILNTNRLVLREITLSDTNAIHEIYIDPRVAEYDSFAPIRTIGEARNIIHNYRKEYKENKRIRWGIARRTDNRMIGTCVFMNFDDVSRRCEIGCGLVSSEWNKGYMAEALESLIDYGFAVLELNRIEACIISGNRASVRLFRKLGFIYEGVAREREYFKGRFHNEIIMSMLRGDYTLISK